MRAHEVSGAAFMRTKGFVEQIAVGEMLKHEAIGIFPIVKGLAAQNMLAHTKRMLMSCLLQ